MEIYLRCLQAFMKIIYVFIYPLLLIALPRKENHKIPPIRNELLTLPLVNVVQQIRQRKLKSEEIVQLYIDRINEVNPKINAIIENRFKDALKEAKQADDRIAKCTTAELSTLFNRYPLLGIPFTVKESCGLKDMSYVVGSLERSGLRCPENGESIAHVLAAGAIPLLISANPEYCLSIETNTYTHGTCRNPYDNRRTPGGSSGGEGALNGAGASLFGIGSDVAGSIRIPSLFNGVFGHKPTGGLTSVKGHFPYTNDPNFSEYCQVGPITRFACDLGFIVEILAGENSQKLDLSTHVDTKSIKIYYALEFAGLNGFLHQGVAFYIELAIKKAVKYFEQMGLTIKRAHIACFRNSLEISLGAIVQLENFPFLINSKCKYRKMECICEYVKSLLGTSMYTKDGINFDLMHRANAFMPANQLSKYMAEVEVVKAKLQDMLGKDSVLFFPTFHVPAIHHHTANIPLWGIDYCTLFNILGFPATHIPMGFDNNGLPVGFQVIAAPYMDKLCFQVATELEAAFGGWKPPSAHQF